MTKRGNCVFWAVLTLVAGLAGPATAEESTAGEWGGIEKLMTREEFRQAGLDKLTPEEMSRLNAWLARFITHDAPHVVKADEHLQELQNAPLRRRIAGEFRGWTGDTTFVLDNGEVWRQRLPGRYAVRLSNPEVEIYRNMLGFYELKVVETGRRIGVTRVR